MSTTATRARHSLKEEAKQIIRQRFKSAPGPRRRVLWWDAGGHLRYEIRKACKELGVPLVKENHPLEFRQWTAEQGKNPSDEPARVVWYLPEAPRGRDWFRDVEHMGGTVERSIEDLAADLYGIESWQLRPWETDHSVSPGVAATLEDELSGRNRPRLQDLQARILTGDDSRPVEHVLHSGWKNLPRHEEVTEKIRALLGEEHVPHLTSEDGPSEIVRKVRRWAVAGWLVQCGVPEEAFPGPIAESYLGYAFRRLEKVLGADERTGVLSTYQETYWPKVISGIDDLSPLMRCPVGGAVEDLIWDNWLSAFEEGKHTRCLKRAETRLQAFKENTGRAGEGVGKESPSWIRAWQQAADLADLARRYETWDEREEPAYALYADREEGSWQIDASVRRIIVSGNPEENLPNGHPAREALSGLRERLVETEYLSYLGDLAGKMETDLSRGHLPKEEIPSCIGFWTEHEKKLGPGSEALIFYIDALRLDLARELADRLRERSDKSSEENLSVQESARFGVLPSETEFGMAAVLPGRPRSYEVRLEDGELAAFRNGSSISTDKRRRLLEREGWDVVSGTVEDRSESRVAYYSKEIDDYGEASMDDIEKRLSERVEKLAENIFDRIRQGGYNRAFVVTDHGFVLLPEGAEFETPPTPDGDVRRRTVGAEDLSEPEDGNGIVLTGEQNPELFSYLLSPVQVLLDPQKRFSKRGIPDSRYYHGGALPQECVLSFLKIESV